MIFGRIVPPLAAVVLAAVLGGTSASASNDWFWATTKQPECEVSANASVTHVTSSHIHMTMSESDCDLLPRDAMHAPTMTMYAWDNDHDWKSSMPLSSRWYQRKPAQWETGEAFSRTFMCVQGHRITVTFAWTSWGSRAPKESFQGPPKFGNVAKHEERIVCGTGKPWS